MMTRPRPNAPSPADEIAWLLGLTSVSGRMQRLDYTRRNTRFAISRGWRWALAHSIPWLIVAAYMAAVYAWQSRVRGPAAEAEEAGEGAEPAQP